MPFSRKRTESALEQERTSLERLAETSAAFSSSLDYEETLARVARAAVPRLADACTVYIREDDGTLSRVAALDVEHEKAEISRSAHREGPIDVDLPFGYPKVLRTGHSYHRAAPSEP